MKIKLLGITLVFLILSCNLSAQTSSIQDYVQEGVQHHDQGDYDKAIETYKKALKIDPKSTLANYEIAMSYFSMEDYKKSIKYCNKVLKEKSDLLVQAYMIKGSALDLMGKTEKSVEIFEKAIKETEGHYLLYYNLALNYYRLNKLEDAEKNAISALQLNSNHVSSHYMLLSIHDQLANSVQTIFTSYYFLFLEPNTSRSLEVYQALQRNYGRNVSKDEDNSGNINISLSMGDDNPFSALELWISIFKANDSLEENKDKTEEEIFLENTDLFFQILGDKIDENNNDIWWTLYAPFYDALSKSEHLETFCYYISQSQSPKAQEWLKNNEDKLIAFDTWLQNN